jgi:hypothetical protein
MGSLEESLEPLQVSHPTIHQREPLAENPGDAFVGFQSGLDPKPKQPPTVNKINRATANRQKTNKGENIPILPHK